MLKNLLRIRCSYNGIGLINCVLQNLGSNVAATTFLEYEKSYSTRSDDDRQQHSTENSQQQNGKRNENDAQKASLPALRNPFDNLTQKSKGTFIEMVKIFEKRDIRRRNHVEFIYAALKSMAEFGVEHDLDVYKALINVMPKGKFIPTNLFQAEFMHYPKQQQCIIDLLEQMEDFGVMPDTEMETILLNIFGKRGHPLRKYWRMMYWMPKFKNLSPWPLPKPMPDDTLEIAKLAVERMCSVDLGSQVTVFETKCVKDSVDDTWIVSGMSIDQSQLLRKHPKNKPLYIEGPFLIWLRNRSLNYFTLRADPDTELLKSFKKPDVNDDDDVSQISVPFFGKPPQKHKNMAIQRQVRSVHQQDDGTIFSICATGTSTKDSLLSWIRLLEANNNPDLGRIPIVFRLKSAIKEQAIQIEDHTSSGEAKIVDKS